MLIKIFGAKSAGELEELVTEWLALNKDVTIIKMTQSESVASHTYGRSFTITFLYSRTG